MKIDKYKARIDTLTNEIKLTKQHQRDFTTLVNAAKNKRKLPAAGVDSDEVSTHLGCSLCEWKGVGG